MSQSDTTYTNPQRQQALCLSIGLAACVLLFANVRTRAADATASVSAEGLDEIVVTAEKRDSTVLKVPISITALSGDDLTAAGVVDLESVAQQVPGISMKTGGPGFDSANSILHHNFDLKSKRRRGAEAPVLVVPYASLSLKLSLDLPGGKYRFGNRTLR